MMQLEIILIVDPDPAAQAGMCQPISEAGFDVVQADSGGQGLMLSGEQMPALVLIHHDMPDMDDITFCQRLRAMPDGRDTPIMLMLNEYNSDIVARAYDSGVDDVIVLPANWQLICHRLHYILRASAAMRTERQKTDDAIRKLAFHDQITGLPNRILFSEHMSMAMHHARRNATQIGLLFLNLDNFKRINDSLGHVAGDTLLQEISHRLQQSIRATDLAATERGDNHRLARLDGDEFTIMLVDISDVAHVNLVASAFWML